MGRNRREVPADWHIMAPKMTQLEAAAYYQCGKVRIVRWMAETGIKCGRLAPNCRRDFPANIAELAKGESIPTLAEKLGWGASTLRHRIRREFPDLHAQLVKNGREHIATSTSARMKGSDHLRRPIPDDFAHAMRTMNRAQMARHYNAHENTVSKWISQMPADLVAEYRQRIRAKATAAVKGTFALKKLSCPTPMQAGVMTLADKAMRWLQRYGPCYPMRIYNKVLDDYSFRGVRMSGQALIAEARKRGWNPDAWRELAA